MLIRKFKVQSKKRMKFIGIWMVSMMLPSGLHAATWLKNLKVEYRNTPLAVGVMHPRFAWQMEVDDKSRGNRRVLTGYLLLMKRVRKSGIRVR